MKQYITHCLTGPASALLDLNEDDNKLSPITATGRNTLDAVLMAKYL